ncbi:acyltransferase [Olivibacter sp. CPCC 100613]|uniref:acyltransferase family protein n=1 Tax=Olivibacter sp. CPCC 100613 TaxID=3079931 RepID=UPI002FFCB756
MHTTTDIKLFKTKQHFEILDGLRGIAAISVVLFHFMEIATPDYNDNFIAHSYLAVDFFFCLSGFVIAYAYDKKIAEIGLWQFFKLRLIRLQPLVLIGSIIGLLAFVFDPFSTLHLKFNAFETILMFLSSCLLIPYPAVPERYFNLFHLNPPTWSLFWEYIANTFYALFLFKIRNKLLWVLTLLAAGLLIYEAHRSGYLGIGFGGDNVVGGGIRIFYSFLAGMLVYRSRWIIKSRLGFIGMSLLLMPVFFIPFTEYNWIVDPLIAVFYFPFLIALGAGAQMNLSADWLCKALGDLSYPLYMVHYPFIWIFMSYVESMKPTMTEMQYIIPIGTVLLIVLAYLVMTFLDMPIRNYLKIKLRKNRPATHFKKIFR